MEFQREEYTLSRLELGELGKNPQGQFMKWLNEAYDAGIPEPNAMVLSTIGADGFPQSRIVLLKSAGEEGYTFFTNYASEKGKAIEINPRVSLLFFWPGIQKQVRITGVAAKAAESESDNYFRSRPRESRLGAWASAQSTKIPSREELDEKVQFYAEKFRGKEIPRPGHWGGFIVLPEKYEFWQGREGRLHDRFLYEKDGDSWKISRLAP